MKLTTHRRLAQTLKINGAIPLLPLYVCMECIGKTVPFDFGSLNMSVQTDNTGNDHMLACILITT